MLVIGVTGCQACELYISSVTFSSMVVAGNGIGSAGQVLQTGVTGAPTWVSPASASALLSTTNTWTAAQTFISSVTISTAVSLGAAGQAVTVSSNITLGGATSLTNVPAL